MAAQFLLEELEAGKDLDSIFFMGSDFGYELSAREIASNLFKIGFGCIAGPTEGHGGQWEVEFNPDDSIAWIDSLET